MDFIHKASSTLTALQALNNKFPLIQPWITFCKVKMLLCWNEEMMNIVRNGECWWPGSVPVKTCWRLQQRNMLLSGCVHWLQRNIFDFSYHVNCSHAEWEKEKCRFVRQTKCIISFLINTQRTSQLGRIVSMSTYCCCDRPVRHGPAPVSDVTLCLLILYETYWMPGCFY